MSAISEIPRGQRTIITPMGPYISVEHQEFVSEDPFVRIRAHWETTGGADFIDPTPEDLRLLQTQKKGS